MDKDIKILLFIIVYNTILMGLIGFLCWLFDHWLPVFLLLFAWSPTYDKKGG